MKRRTFTGSFTNVHLSSKDNYLKFYPTPAMIPCVGPKENPNGFTVLSLSIMSAAGKGYRPTLNFTNPTDADYNTRHSKYLLLAFLDTDLVAQYDPDWETRNITKSGSENASKAPALSKVNLEFTSTPIKYTDPNDPEITLSVANSGPTPINTTSVSESTAYPQTQTTGHYMIHVIEKYNQSSPIFTHGLYVPPNNRLIIINREDISQYQHNYTAQVVIH
jgi:hypothetical protein